MVVSLVVGFLQDVQDKNESIVNKKLIIKSSEHDVSEWRINIAFLEWNMQNLDKYIYIYILVFCLIFLLALTPVDLIALQFFLENKWQGTKLILLIANSWYTFDGAEGDTIKLVHSRNF